MIIREKFLDIFTGKVITVETDSRDYLEEVKQDENSQTKRESDDCPS
jgi:hypothetical protein